MNWVLKNKFFILSGIIALGTFQHVPIWGFLYGFLCGFVGAMLDIYSEGI